MVVKEASPPMTLEMGSATNTPYTPIHRGSSSVSGTTRITYRKMEKNTADFALPRHTKVDWAENCSDLNTKAMT